MKPKELLLLGITLSLLTSGCAFSRTETQVHFSPSVTYPLNAQKKSTLTVGEFVDSRLVQDKYVLFHKANAYGTTSGAYVTKEPVADILKTGLTAALAKNDFISTNGAPYELHGDLQNLGGGVIQGMWSNTAKAEITVRFELIEKNTRQVVWHDILRGQASKKVTFADANFFAEIFTETATELTKNLIADKTFRSFFE